MTRLGSASHVQTFTPSVETMKRKNTTSKWLLVPHGKLSVSKFKHITHNKEYQNMKILTETKYDVISPDSEV